MDDQSPASIADGNRQAVEVQVPAELSGQRLDRVAANLFGDYSRERLKQWIADGHLKLNGETAARPRVQVMVGDRLQLQAQAEPQQQVRAQALPLDVVYRDEDLAVINKPAGLTVHPGAGQADSTMQNALLHHFPETATVPRAGLVHRLDKLTSGLLMVALNLRAHTALVRALQAREIDREYEAVVHGVLTGGGQVDAPIGRHPSQRTRMAVVANGRPSVTHYRILRRYAHHCHLRLKLETGRTHQIRVHMQHLRYPLVGDPVYGSRNVRGSGFTDQERAAIQQFPRQALHAAHLALTHPSTGESLSFDTPLPADLQQLLELLATADLHLK